MKSPRTAAIRAQLPITKALYWAATEMPDPVLYRDDSPVSEQTRRMGVQVTYDPPWKIAFRLLAAKRQFKQVKLDLLNQLWQFRRDVRNAYTELVVALANYDILSELSDLARKLLNVSQKRFQAGDVAELDVLKAQLATSQADIDRANALVRIQRARQALNIILGRNYRQAVEVIRLPSFRVAAEKNELLPDFEMPVPREEELMREAIENRLDLQSIYAQIKVARAQLYNAYANIVPDPQVAVGNSTVGNAPSGPKLDGSFVSLNLELPIFTYSQGDIARLKATMRQLHIQTAATKNQITADVSSAYNNMIAARERIRAYQEHVLADSGEVARLARRSYEVGQSDITSTLQAQQANVAVKTQYLDAVTTYVNAFTDLEKAVNEPLQ